MNAPRRVRRQLNGVLLLDKPYQISSNGALQKARWLFNAAKAGHTGILDPLATGLLPVCFGEATKFSSCLLDADKAYRAIIRFGQRTTTGDIEGEVIQERPVNFGREQLLAALAKFTGAIQQIPPMYSALKYQGRALYEYAREGVEIARAARQVMIHQIELLDFEGVQAEIAVRCSKGTYIRTLAEDIGEHLEAGAHLLGLRRTHTAGFALEQAHTLDELDTLTEEARDQLLLPVDCLLSHFPKILLPEMHALRFCHGQTVRLDENREIMSRCRVYHSETMAFLGLAELAVDAELRPVRLMAAQAV